jgi:hypothetical protein
MKGTGLIPRENSHIVKGSTSTLRQLAWFI